MRNSGKIIFSAIIIALASISCTKDKMDNFASSVVSYKQYMPMKVGSVQLYRLDSTVVGAFEATLETHYYVAKDSVTLQTLNATGDTTYFVDRFLTDTLREEPWKLATAYQVIFTKNTADLIEANGMRFIKLTIPVRDNYSWDGNSYFMSGYIDSSSNPYNYYLNWDYTYNGTQSPLTVNGINYDNTVTVNEINDSAADDPIKDVRVSREIYAAGTGLISKNQLFYTYFPDQGYDTRSFGIKLTRIQ